MSTIPKVQNQEADGTPLHTTVQWIMELGRTIPLEVWEKMPRDLSSRVDQIPAKWPGEAEGPGAPDEGMGSRISVPNTGLLEPEAPAMQSLVEKIMEIGRMVPLEEWAKMPRDLSMRVGKLPPWAPRDEGDDD